MGAQQYTRREVIGFLGLAAASLLPSLGCDDEHRRIPPSEQPLTGRTVQKVLDDLVALYQNGNLVFVVGAAAPAEDVLAIADISTAFQQAVGQTLPPGTTVTDSDIISEAPNFQRGMFAVGSQPVNMVIDSLVSDYLVQPYQLPPTGEALLQTFTLPTGKEALTIMATREEDRRKAARVLADVLKGTATYDLKGNVVRVYGSTTDIHTEVIR